MGMETTHGSLEVGKHGDIVVVDAPRWEHIIYQFGGLPPLRAVIKDGVVQHPSDERAARRETSEECRRRHPSANLGMMSVQ
jgi:cytosine/adenosine deaminase-related metal-dependent hydrolase